jgi:diamine N-acetyltransferase
LNASTSVRAQQVDGFQRGRNGPVALAIKEVPMAAQIRRADAADALVVALLGRITFAETFGYLFQEHPGDLHTYLDATFDVAKIERSLGKSENVYWLAFLNRLPVGFAKLKDPSHPPGRPSQHAAQLQKIYVLGLFLGERIGRDLLDQVIPEAAGRAPMLWLEVLRENDRAIGFYAKHGFGAIGVDTFAIGQQHFQFHLMGRPVS